MSRREFVGATASAAVGASMETASPHNPDPPPPPLTGEPYELSGQRLVFTDWFYVRPGGFGWYDAKGNNVTVSGSSGPLEAHFRRVDYPPAQRPVLY